VDAGTLEALTDGELIELIERLDYAGHDRDDLVAALDELFRRIRAEAEPGERPSVEAAIARLKRLFSDEDDDAPAGGGVREPRRPPPDFDVGAVHLAS
jgi:hypothetical protein